MTVTYYLPSLEEALKRAKAAAKQPGCYYGGIVLPGGRKGFALYRAGREVARFTSAAH